MSADFWAGYLSGAIGIVVGNPLDIIKVRSQAGSGPVLQSGLDTGRPILSFRGAAAPVLGYGALNALLYITYNRTLKMLDPSVFDPTKLAGVDLSKIWMAGVAGGAASWVVSAPSELIKCRAQLAVDGRSSSLSVLKDVWKTDGLRGLYLGGVVTSLRDSIGYGFFFWSYELSKRILLSRQHDPFLNATTVDVLISGGVAGVTTWASIYPLDVLKTRIQAQSHLIISPRETDSLLNQTQFRKTTWRMAREIYHAEGLVAFWRGFGVCSLRAFVVSAVQVELRPSDFQDAADSDQWYTYEKTMTFLTPKR